MLKNNVPQMEWIYFEEFLHVERANSRLHKVKEETEVLKSEVKSAFV